MCEYTDVGVCVFVFVVWHTRIPCKELVVFFLILFVFLLIGGLVTFIGVQNLALWIHLDVFLWRTSDLPVGVWLVAAFLCGAVALYLVAVLAALGDRRKMKTLRRQVLTLQEQVTAVSQTGSSATVQTESDRLSLADTGPMISVPGVVSTPQPGGRIPSSPLSPVQNFRQ